ncbi:hypothetical protein GCM10011374_21390 [Kocuria dechangensis]|jgi:hypothetical protein|uniref:Uncharacterized protein n=1 Tax=Kocuria dechangensis TaxID=1176249 RepID=A0A917LUK3_9MICC|nr:hypothetical protein [Kocuria dechangensis]GGG58290.1 hypothetical protein GCM10011374_21390 [Kocuria dechangensis]
MADPQSPVKDANYDLLSILEASLKMAWKVDAYIKDADAAGDTELADWFRKIQENNLKAGTQGKRMLIERLQKESG